jgi:hypothetical protein
MRDEGRFQIPETCRDFAKTNFEERLNTAKGFIETFVKMVAPPTELDERDEAWTRSVRRRFIKICPKDCYASPNDPDTRKGEYLVDYTWEEVEKGKRVLLAGESEWGTEWYGKTVWSRVEHDFEKLLAMKAPFKVLVFSSVRGPRASRNEPGVDFAFDYAQERLKVSLQNYWGHLAGEVYIFVDFPQTGVPHSDGEYKSFIWMAKAFGRNEVEFELGPHGKLNRPKE